MSFENSSVFTKENLNMYFKELSKEYKKLGGRKMPVEIILIGGAAIIENYGFRDMTTDIDAILPSVSIMNEAINHIGERFGLPKDWLNSDFIKTDSYTPELFRYSVPYRTFNQILDVRIVTGEYIIAMKLRSARKYKKDLSDIVGILNEHEVAGNSISFEMIDKAVKNLYGSWSDFSEDAVNFIRKTFDVGRYQERYVQIRESEKSVKEMLVDFQDRYPGVLSGENLSSVVEKRAEKLNKTDILKKLKGRL